MKHLSLILLSIVIFSCKSDIESIQGHWHETAYPENNTYRTLDIEDSLIYMNKYDRSGWYSSSKIKYDGDNLVTKMGPYGAYYLSSKIVLKSDTLILMEFYNDSSFGTGLASMWLRAKNDLNDNRKDITSNMIVEVSLEIDNSSIHFDSISKYNKWGIINIGFPKFNNDKYPKDSLLFNANDGIGDFSQIDDYYEAELESINDNPHINNHDSIIAIINADLSTPDIYFDSIFYYLEQCKQISAVYRTYLNDDFYGLGLKKLQ